MTILPSYIVFDDKVFSSQVKEKWFSEHQLFQAVLDSIDKTSVRLKKAAENNFKRWKILKHTDKDYHFAAYDTYKDAVEDLKKWIGERCFWIESEMQKEPLSEVVVNPLDTLVNPEP